MQSKLLTRDPIKVVASYEAAKGVLALMVAVAVVIWRNALPEVIQSLIFYLRHLFGSLIATQLDYWGDKVEAAAHYGSWAALALFCYSLLRFLEAYGLFRSRSWAYWFSLLGYGLFLPLEMYKLIQNLDSLMHWLVVIINLLVIWVMYQQMRRKGLLNK
ncbi:DUF2127 domain-containing protein [Conservatibacter flavescens]|uniref:DUF2127 domain-containing protein n=1 Tax=Conservatibacter flavescens TaxID=28161 RepID=A0A2M8S4S1_9PAST|nr:DUF2127 domain-containing protein [Conservatibacter flavescens]PJG86142.1 DUF2127 domain-containing protein [Conservatibacter flavescens]